MFPCCGKVLVIDDQMNEAMPLLHLLGKKGVSSTYYSGNVSELPESPFDKIRLVFCDLKYNPTSDAKNVASTVLSILKALISEKNGPYILLAWSAHGADYLEELQKVLDSTTIKPEFILQLDKSEFFSTMDNDSLFDDIIESVHDLDLSIDDEAHVKSLIREKTNSLRSSWKEPLPDALESIEKKLAEELKKANLFHLFVLWENTISSSAVETVNNIYDAIPDNIPSSKKLCAMLFYLASIRLEKRMEDADEDMKFHAAMDSLNELFAYFYYENVYKLSFDDIELDRILALEEVKSISPARFNQWKMITKGVNGHHSGNIYFDTEKLFQYHGLIDKDYFKNEENKEEYDAIVAELKENTNIQYILLDLSSDCDIAQRKIYVSRVVPGIMIPTEDKERYCKEKKIKNSCPDYISVLSPVEYNGKSWYIAFNTNQMCAIQMDKLLDDNLLCALTSTYITWIKQRAAACVSKQGIAKFA